MNIVGLVRFTKVVSFFGAILMLHFSENVFALNVSNSTNYNNNDDNNIIVNINNSQIQDSNHQGLGVLINNKSESSLTFFSSNVEKNSVVCGIQNYNWYDQYGPDIVKAIPIKPKDVIIQADQITGIIGGEHYAAGNVVGYDSNTTIISDWLLYDQQKSHATASNVVLTRQYDTIQGKWVDYYLDLHKGMIKNATVLENKSSLYAYADQINVYNKEHVGLESVVITSCNIKDPEWHIAANRASFDYQNSMGNARNMKFYVNSVPIMALPYFSFPLGKRKSGFLIPVFTGSNNTGFGVGVPYYWNIAPNYDFTFTPMFYSKSGILMSGQFRYLTENSSGELYTGQSPLHWNNKGYRYYYHLNNVTKLGSDLMVGYEFNQVSDSNYFVDYGDLNSVVNQINLPQRAYANYNPDWGSIGLQVQRFQTLIPSVVNQQVQPIYSMLPQLTLRVNPYKIGNIPLHLNLASQYSNFQGGETLQGTVLTTGSNSFQNGQRIVIYPSLFMPLQNSWGFLNPKIGYNYTNYQLAPFVAAQSGLRTIERSVPTASIDTGLLFDRTATLFGSEYVQTLEPRVYYLYTPQVNQANIPLFDTAPVTYNLNQLFSENRFSGFDRINSANDLTLGLSSSLIDNNTGIQRANWGVGFRQYLTPQNNAIYGTESQFPALYQPQPNLITQLSNNWGYNFSTNISAQYSTVFNNIDQYSFQLQYKPDQFKVLNAKFNYQYAQPILFYAYTPGQIYNAATYENQHALDISGQWPLFSNRWMIEGRLNYDFTSNKLMNALMGIAYNGGCWGVHLVFEKYITNINQYTDAQYLMFQLKGLGDVGYMGDPTQELQNNIPGYTPFTSVR